MNATQARIISRIIGRPLTARESDRLRRLPTELKPSVDLEMKDCFTVAVDGREIMLRVRGPIRRRRTNRETQE